MNKEVELCEQEVELSEQGGGAGLSCNDLDKRLLHLCSTAGSLDTCF